MHHHKKVSLRNQVAQTDVSVEESVFLDRLPDIAQAVADAQFVGTPIVLLVNRDDPLRLRTAQAIAEMLTAAGLTVTIPEVSGQDYLNALEWGEYDLFLGQTKLSANMDLTAFFAEKGSPCCCIYKNLFSKPEVTSMKLIPLNKQSKKEQKKYYARSRRDWNGLKPTTRVVKNKKIYDRKKMQKPNIEQD